MSKNTNLRGQIEGFTDEVEGELEKHSIGGVPITRKVSLSILCLLGLVVISFGVFIGARLAKEEGQGNSEVVSTLSNDDRAIALAEVLEPLVGPHITDPDTPEGKALEWMATIDPARIPVESHIDLLTQRFVLATLYEATGGLDWDAGHTFMTFKDVCDWNDGSGLFGVYCSNGYVTRLQLDEMNLIGTLPRSLPLLGHLESLSLARNSLKGTLPDSIGLWKKLKSLDISSNGFFGEIPLALRDVESLQVANLSNNQFYGRIRAYYFARLSNLKKFDVSSNKLTELHSGISAGSNLEYFDASFNRIPGGIPSEIGLLPKLKVLRLIQNELTGTFPTEIGGMPTLEQLEVSGNDVSGNLPSEIGSMPNLKILRASNTRMSGSLPLELGDLGSIGILELDGNGFDETIPTEMGKIKSVQILNLSGNFFSGPIPTELGDLHALEKLDLSDNELEGEIPEQLSRLGNLEEMLLHNNRLDGTIPSDFSNMNELGVFSVKNNHVFGDLTSRFCQRPDGWAPLQALEADCLSDEVICDCCTKCCDGAGYCCDKDAVCAAE